MLGGGGILTCECRLHVLIIVCRHNNLEADFPASLGVGTCGPEPGTIYSKTNAWGAETPRLGAEFGPTHAYTSPEPGKGVVG